MCCLLYRSLHCRSEFCLQSLIIVPQSFSNLPPYCGLGLIADTINLILCFGCAMFCFLCPYVSFLLAKLRSLANN